MICAYKIQWDSHLRKKLPIRERNNRDILRSVTMKKIPLGAIYFIFLFLVPGWYNNIHNFLHKIVVGFQAQPNSAANLSSSTNGRRKDKASADNSSGKIVPISVSTPFFLRIFVEFMPFSHQRKN